MLKKWFNKHFYIHFVNDNNLPGNNRKGPIWRHGRMYVHTKHPSKKFGYRDPDIKDLFDVSWCLFIPKYFNLYGFGIKFHNPGGERMISGRFSPLPGANFYWGYSRRNLPKWWFEKLGLYKPKSAEHPYGEYTTREITLSVHDWKAWFSIWKKEHEWSSSDPWWMSFNFSLNPLDLFGSQNYDSQLVEAREVDVPMPEGTYKGTVELRADTWKRPHLPWGKTILRTHIDMQEPIPHPGKGTTSYNCGDDATHGMCCTARTVEEGIGTLVASVLRNRKRYGGSHYFTSREDSKLN